MFFFFYKTITILSPVSSIGNSAFYYFSSLTQITIPSSLKIDHIGLYSDGDYSDSLPQTRISLLHVAAYYNSLQCFQYLQKEKYLFFSSNKLFPFYYALYSGSEDVSLYILKEDPAESILHPEESKKLSLLYFFSFLMWSFITS